MQKCRCLSGCAGRLEDISEEAGSTNDCGVSLSENNAVTLVHYVIRDENLLVEMCYIAISFVLPLIWEQKTISSFATFAWIMIDISIPVMELLTVSFGL